MGKLANSSSVNCKTLVFMIKDTVFCIYILISCIIHSAAFSEAPFSPIFSIREL